MKEDLGKLFIGASDYGSHMPLIWEIINKVPHDYFVEFGCGMESTPALQEYYEKIGNPGKFISYETNKEWAEKFPGVRHIERYDEIIFFHRGPMIFFIDCAPGELRKELVHMFKGVAQVIIVHDTQMSANYVYGLYDVLNTFKYRKDYMPKDLPYTTAVSNFIEL